MRIDPRDLGDLPLFSAAQAKEWGISDKDLRILVRRGLIRRLDRGWYSTWMSATAEELHLLRTAAALELHGETVAANRHSALIVHGLPLVRTDLRTVELVRNDGTHGRRREGIRESQGRGVPLTSVRVAALDRELRTVAAAHAIVGTAMSNSPVAALAAGDRALRDGICTHTEMIDALDFARGCSGVARARLALEALDPRHESPGETWTAWELRRLGWDVDAQVEVVAGGKRYRLDFALTTRMVAIEFDGKIKYEQPGALAAQEKRQQDIADLGWVFVRLGWDDLVDPVEVNHRIRAAAAAAPPRR